MTQKRGSKRNNFLHKNVENLEKKIHKEEENVETFFVTNQQNHRNIFSFLDNDII